MEEEKFTYKFGGEVRFLPIDNVGLYDTEGNIILCQCAAKATETIIGKDWYIARCSDCLWPELE